MTACPVEYIVKIYKWYKYIIGTPFCYLSFLPFFERGIYMKRFFVVLSICLFAVTIIAGNKDPKVIKNKMGIYYSSVQDIGFYMVDTTTQICFVKFSQSTPVCVPCAKLKKRPEWKNIITWDD